MVTISVGISKGVIQCDTDTELFSLVSKADNHLFMAMTKVRNCVVACT